MAASSMLAFDEPACRADGRDEGRVTIAGGVPPPQRVPPRPSGIEGIAQFSVSLAAKFFNLGNR